MGYAARDTSRLFAGFDYSTKTTPEVREAMERKLETLRANIADREARVAKIRDQYNIDAERLAVLVMRFQENKEFISYEKQGANDGEGLIPAGVIANLVREHEMIDSEREQMWRIELINRNLRDEQMYYHPKTGEIMTRAALHDLSDRDLEYLGF